jgi:oligoribonuclease
VKLVWFDCETTGFDPRKHTILEIAVDVVDISTPFKLEDKTRFVLDFDDAHHYGSQCLAQQEPAEAAVREWAAGTLDRDGPCFACNFSPEARAMHERTGLLAACKRSSMSMRSVEDHLLRLVRDEPDSGDEKPTLAGSSVHLDHEFLQVHAPRFAARLSHRHYDVSAVKLFCESLGMPRVAKANAHSAMEDVAESVRHARHCVRWLQAAGSLIGRLPGREPILESPPGSPLNAPIVHTLFRGYALCGFLPTVPNTWPAGHRWVSHSDPRAADQTTCDACRRKRAWMRAGETGHPLVGAMQERGIAEGVRSFSNVELESSPPVNPHAGDLSGDYPRVHVLYEGHPLCGFSMDNPSAWPTGHRWVSRAGLLTIELVTCGQCREAHQGGYRVVSVGTQP